MKLRKLLTVFLCGTFAVAMQAAEATADTLAVHFATKTEAEKLIVAPDDFFRHLNQFDYDLRLRKPGSTPKEWLDLVKRETCEWTPEEKQRIIQTFRTLRNNAKEMGLRLPCPEKVIMVKTTMREELDAGGYTRKNWIALADNVMKRATDIQLARLVSHEMFHILSRHSLDFKKKVYATIDFKLLDCAINYPKDLMEKRISNPDISRRDSYIELVIAGKKVHCAEIIYTNRPYTEGSIMDYLQVGFVPLDAHFRPVIKDGKTVIYPLEKVMKQFTKKVGVNTNYNIDPEEISADHFSFLMTKRQGLPNPEILEQIKKCLQ